MGLPRQAGALLILEVDGMPGAVEAEAGIIERVCREMGAGEFRTAADAAEADLLWKARRAVSPAISRASPTKIGEDICVPRSAIPAMVGEIREMAGV